MPEPPEWVETGLLGAIGVWGAVYLWRAIRRIEGFSVWSTLWRLVVISALYLAAFGGALGLLILGIFWWAGGQ